MMSEQRAKRFYEQISTGPADCLNWTGNLMPSGHGTFGVGTRTYPAHRLAYVYERGPIEDGMEIDHLCANKRCVNTAHLEVVDRSTNQQRANDRAAVSSLVLMNRLLKRQGRNKTWLAQELGISRQAIYMWDDIPRNRLDDVAAVLGVDVERLTTEEPILPNPIAARNIRLALKASGRSQKWLAARMGIRREELYAKFSNGFLPEEEELLASILQIPRIWLFPEQNQSLAGISCEQEK